MTRASRFFLRLAVALLFAASASALTPVRDPGALLKDAEISLRDTKRDTDTVTACRQIIDAPKASSKAKARAFDILIAMYARNKDWQAAIDAAAEMRKTFPDRVEIDRHATFSQADQYLAWNAESNAVPAIAALKAYTERRPDDHEGCAQAFLRIAGFQSKAGQNEPAFESAAQALKTDPGNTGLGLDALWLQQDLAARMKNPELRLKALARSLEPTYRAALSASDLTTRREVYAAALVELKRYDDLRTFLGELERTDTAPVRRQKWSLQLADSYRDQARLPEALAAYERVFTQHPEVNTKWQDAQARIVDVLAALGRNDDALRAAHVLYDAAPSAGVADTTANRLAELLKTADGQPTRADALMAMHRFGPLGRDRKPGTPDDPTPILPAIGYPDATARRKAFEAAFPTLGDGADASLQRGWCCVFAADPRAATGYFADALRRCRMAQALAVARTVTWNGFRAMAGHSGGLDDVGAFIAWGAVGPDGTPGTADDLSDPFGPLGLSGPSRAPGGIVPLKTGEVAALKALTADLRELLIRSQTTARQKDAADAYQRVCEALVTVDRKETLAWIRATIHDQTDDGVVGALARLGETVAKADQLDLSGTAQFWADLVRDFETAHRALPADLASLQRQCRNTQYRLDSRRK